MKIKSITRKNYNGFVYNIGVDVDNTYFAEGALVHNCRSILVPITKFEDYKADKPIPVDTLKEWGAGLILPDSK